MNKQAVTTIGCAVVDYNVDFVLKGRIDEQDSKGKTESLSWLDYRL